MDPKGKEKVTKKSSVKSTFSSDGRNVKTKATLGKAREKKKKKMLAEPTIQVQEKTLLESTSPQESTTRTAATPGEAIALVESDGSAVSSSNSTSKFIQNYIS